MRRIKPFSILNASVASMLAARAHVHGLAVRQSDRAHRPAEIENRVLVDDTAFLVDEREAPLMQVRDDREVAALDARSRRPRDRSRGRRCVANLRKRRSIAAIGYAHTLGGTIAMLLGRSNSWVSCAGITAKRTAGRTYLMSVAAGGLAGLYLAPGSYASPPTAARSSRSRSRSPTRVPGPTARSARATSRRTDAG